MVYDCIFVIHTCENKYLQTCWMCVATLLCYSVWNLDLWLQPLYTCVSQGRNFLCERMLAIWDHCIRVFPKVDISCVKECLPFGHIVVAYMNTWFTKTSYKWKVLLGVNCKWIQFIIIWQIEITLVVQILWPDQIMF